MKDSIFSGIRIRLILLVILALVFIALLIGFNVREQRRHALGRATAEAGVVFKLAVMNEEKILLETKELLQRLAETPDVVRAGDCGAYLAAILKNHPRYRNFGLILPDGELSCSALPHEGPVNLGDRFYFRRALETGSFSIGMYQVGRITKKPTINFGYPVFNASRKVTGVVFAALDPSYLSEFEKEISGMLPAGSVFVKIDRGGTVLAGFPENPHFRIGEPMERSIYERISREKMGMFVAADSGNGDRIYLFSTLWGEFFGDESYMLLGIPMKSLLAESEESLARNLAFLALVAVATVILFWYVGERLIVKPVNRVVKAAKRLAAGDLTARADLPREKGELGYLGLAFDEMAGELERKAQTLLQVRTRLAHFLSASPAVIYACRFPQDYQAGKGIFPVFMSERIRELLGYEPGEVLANPGWLEENAHPEDLSAAMDPAGLFRDGILSREYRIRSKGGEYRWVLDQLVLVRDEAGAPLEVVGSLTDITCRKKTEETLGRLGMAVGQAAEAIVVADGEGKVEYVNPAFEIITGYSVAETIGQGIRALQREGQDDALTREIWETISTGGVWKGRFVNRRKDGALYDEQATFSPVRDESGRIVSFIAAIRDVTQEVLLQKQLQIAQRMEAVGVLAGGVAHDFNNALTGIFGFTEIASMQVAGNEGAVSNLNEIRRCAERAATLTRQLLAYSRRQILSPVNLKVNGLIEELMKLVSNMAGPRIRIRTVFGKDLPYVHADAGQVEQVLINLIINARDAMPSGGDLVIETGVAELDDEYVLLHPYMSAGRFVVLSVSDTGTGMDKAVRDRVFEPFFTTKGPDKGTGLGLAMVYGIVKQHKGFIHLYSETGVGTTFRIYLPTVHSAPDAIEPVRTPEVKGGTETLLVAEDDDSVRALVKRTLENLGYTVLAASSGEEAVELFKRNRESVSLAILDVVMKEMGGKETYREMSGMKSGLKAIFMSGYAETYVHESFVLLPGVPFLQKPFTPKVLARKVREVLDSTG
jgi:PAS domain S-box-containing protein